MKYIRVYSPAKDQGMYTAAEFKKLFGTQRKRVLELKQAEVLETEIWHKQFLNYSKPV